MMKRKCWWGKCQPVTTESEHRTVLAVITPHTCDKMVPLSRMSLMDSKKY